MIFSARTAATLVLTATLASTGLFVPAPAQAADFYGAGPGECPAALASRGTELGFVTAMTTGGRFSGDIDLGATPTSAAWIRAPRTTARVAGEQLDSWSGYVVVDRAGSGWFVRQAENGMLVSRTKIRGPWRGLRAVVGAAQTGDPAATTSATRVLYGITRSGGLIRMLVSWNAKGTPGVGAAVTIARGYDDYVALRFSGYTHEANTPLTDRLVGVTRSGRFTQVDVTRGAKPRATVRILARRGFAGLTEFVTDQCWQDGRADAWVVRGRNGSLARYVDADVTDTSLRGSRKTSLPGRLPAGVRIL